MRGPAPVFGRVARVLTYQEELGGRAVPFTPDVRQSELYKLKRRAKGRAPRLEPDYRLRLSKLFLASQAPPPASRPPGIPRHTALISCWMHTRASTARAKAALARSRTSSL